MKLNRNNKIKLRIDALKRGIDKRGLADLNRALAETNATLPSRFDKDLSVEQREFLAIINIRMEELKAIIFDTY
jgi:hypothetical protein